MNLPKDLKYAKTHEWVRFLEDGTAEIGLTDFAQKELGDLVFVNLPEEGDAIDKEKAFADVESVKAVSDVFSPLSGTVTAINEELLDAPETINSAPYDAWMVRVGNISGQQELLNADEYAAFLSGKEEG